MFVTLPIKFNVEGIIQRFAPLASLCIICEFRRRTEKRVKYTDEKVLLGVVVALFMANGTRV